MILGIQRGVISDLSIGYGSDVLQNDSDDMMPLFWTSNTGEWVNELNPLVVSVYIQQVFKVVLDPER